MTCQNPFNAEQIRLEKVKTKNLKEYKHQVFDNEEPTRLELPPVAQKVESSFGKIGESMKAGEQVQSESVVIDPVVVSEEEPSKATEEGKSAEQSV
jgi:hypothetical protein